jgi:hypothetical protein
MKVFISHSTQDQGLVISLAQLLQQLGIQVFVAEWYLSPGARLDMKIKKQIRDADFVVVLLTRNGIRSTWVQQEIGIAVNAEKPIIPIVEQGTQPGDLAALQGREYIEYDPRYPGQALAKVIRYLNSQRLQKKEQEKWRLIAAGIIGLFVLLLLAGGEQ